MSELGRLLHQPFSIGSSRCNLKGEADMARINTDFLVRCIGELERFLEELERHEPGEFYYDLSRAACVKEFELVLEQSGSLLRRRLRPFFASAGEANRLVFKDLFRYAARVELISPDAAERWFDYRDLRNDTAHLYGEELAETTLRTLHSFIQDAEELARIIGEDFDE